MSNFEEVNAEENEHYSVQGVVCPYCGYIHTFDDFETSDFYEYLEVNCTNCGKPFASDCYTSYSWTTTKVGG